MLLWFSILTCTIIRTRRSNEPRYACVGVGPVGVDLTLLVQELTLDYLSDLLDRIGALFKRFRIFSHLPSCEEAKIGQLILDYCVVPVE